MCGRYLLHTAPKMLAEAFDLPDSPDLPARYNIAPSQLVAVVGLKPDRVHCGVALLRWGLIPHWVRSDKGPRPINARAETAATKFRKNFLERRCLIPASGFYEWLTVGRTKQPHLFTVIDAEIFAFAGIWDYWSDESQRVTTTCIITTSANDRVRPIHQRMPVIIPRENYAEWLDSGTTEERLHALLQPIPADQMRVVEVGPAVNSPKNDGPECLERRSATS